MQKTILSLVGAIAAPVAMAGTPVSAPVAAAPEASHAFSYDYAQASYVQGWLDDDLLGSGLFQNSSGYAVDLSKSVGTSFFVYGGIGQSFSNDSADIYGTDVEGDLDTMSVELGVGFHFPITNRIDWVIKGAGTWNRAEMDLSADGYDFDDIGSVDGFGAQVATGFRIALTSSIELGLFYQYNYMDAEFEVDGQDYATSDADVSTGYADLVFRNIGVENLDLVLSSSFGESAVTAGAGIRYNY